MKMIDLIEGHKRRLLTNHNDYTCLLFALQLPSICSRIEFPQTSENTGKFGEGKFYRKNGSPWDKNMYKGWLAKHSDSFADIYRTSMEVNTFCEIMYDLRCKMTHEGVLITDNNHFYFTNDNNAMLLGNVVFLPMKRLCEKMFDVATMVLSNRCEDFNVTPFEDIFLPDDMYFKIRDNVNKVYKSFWDKYSIDDNLLNCIYDHIILDNPDIKSEIDGFFKSRPDDILEVWDFGSKFGCVIDIEQRFIKWKHYKNKSTHSLFSRIYSDVLCLSKSDYERMIQVHQELENFTNAHPFDITQYTMKGT